MKSIIPLSRLFAGSALFAALALFATPVRAIVHDFGGAPVSWSGGSLNVDVFSGAYDFLSGHSTSTTAVFHYFGANDQIVTTLGGSSLSFTTPSGPRYDEYSSNVGFGGTVGAGSLWGGPGSLYKNGNSEFASGIEGFLGFRIYDSSLAGYRYGYFSLTRDQPSNSWKVNGLELADAANQSIVTRSLAPASVPDTGATLVLLGGALAGMTLLRRRTSPAAVAA